MPLASLSTLAVMKPGPTTAKNKSIRVLQRRKNLMGRMIVLDLMARHCRHFRINGEWGIWVVKVLKTLCTLQLGPQQTNYVVGRDYACELLFVVHNGQSDQV